MSLANIWIHPQNQLNISKPTLAFVQMPLQTVNTAQNSVAICQHPYNMPSSALSKRSNPYEGFDSVEKKLKVPESAFVVQVVPQNASNNIYSPQMVSLQGFEQPWVSKPQGYQHIQNLKGVGPPNTGGYINIAAPQLITTQVYQQFGGQTHQLGANQVLMGSASNPLGQLHLQASTPFQVMAPTTQEYVIAKQSNWNFTGNFNANQNVQILNAKNLNFGFQQQLPQAVVVPYFQNTSSATMISQSSSMMSTGSFHQVQHMPRPDETKKTQKAQRDVTIENKAEKEQVLGKTEKKEERHPSAFLNKRKNWKRVDFIKLECKNKLATNLSQIQKAEAEAEAEIERKNIVLTSSESENQAKTLPSFEDKPVGKKSVNPNNSPISVDSAESTALGYKTSPNQEETPSS